MLLSNMLTPPDSPNIVDLNDPDIKQYFSDACNFYHNKSGIWLTGTDNELDKKT
jgi:hypothetical protein